MKDSGELLELMSLVENCVKHGSAFENIRGLAMLELQEANRQAGPELAKRKEQFQQREAKERAEQERRNSEGERPALQPAPQPPQTTARSPQEPILQRPDEARSIPNEGPATPPSPQGRFEGSRAEYERQRETQNTRDVALGERRLEYARPGEPVRVEAEDVDRRV
jgi:hypothetical protein